MRRFQRPHSSLKTSQQETPSTIYKWYILPETTVTDLHFCRSGRIGKPSESTLLVRKPSFTWIATQDHSRWFILQSVTGLISEVSEEVASHSNPPKLPSSRTPLSFEVPAKRNPREYPHMPYISRNWPRFLSLHAWVYLYSNSCSGLQNTHLFCIREHQSAFWPFKVIEGR